jgi:hypothetical protein
MNARDGNSHKVQYSKVQPCSVGTSYCSLLQDDHSIRDVLRSAVRR